jgi:hypothetical protein
MEYINKNIPIIPSLYTNIMKRTSQDIKDAHSQKGKEKKKEKKDPATVIDPSQQPGPNHQYYTHDHIIGSPKAKPPISPGRIA